MAKNPLLNDFMQEHNIPLAAEVTNEFDILLESEEESQISGVKTKLDKILQERLDALSKD